MADLMNGTYTYDKLRGTYGNFQVPAVKVMINGQDALASMDLTLNEIIVTLSLKYASSVEIRISNAYDIVKRSFDDKMKSKFKLGTVVEIELGYLSSTQAVFKGFVYMVGADFSEAPMYVVTLMDARRLMMVSGIKHILHDVKNYSDAFKTAIGPYSKLFSAQTEITDDKLEDPISQTTNDYDFVINDLIKKGKTGREFFILYDKGYFRTKPQSGTPIMKIELGRELLNFKMDYAYLDVEIEVVGVDESEQKSISGKAAAKSKEAQDSLISETPVITVVDPDVNNQEKADTRAKALAAMEDNAAKTGNGTCIGLPEIVPGRYIEIVMLEEMVNRKYYITEVKHTVGSNFFTTDFEIGGWI